ncbi:MAG: hypothetical protein M3R57_09765 [Chloroflexota bacterium]|nr:hypothetical protein [Chloroflexota bacterium]
MKLLRPDGADALSEGGVVIALRRVRAALEDLLLGEELATAARRTRLAQTR